MTSSRRHFLQRRAALMNVLCAGWRGGGDVRRIYLDRTRTGTHMHTETPPKKEEEPRIRVCCWDRVHLGPGPPGDRTGLMEAELQNKNKDLSCACLT